MTQHYIFLIKIHTLQKVTNSDLSKVMDWLSSNKLSININNTNYMVFRPSSNTRNDTQDIQLRIQNTPLKHISSHGSESTVRKLWDIFGPVINPTKTKKTDMDK